MLAEEILIVNDGSLLLKMMASLLESKGYHISLTDSPEEALPLLSTRHIVLVVMKLNGQQTDRLAVAHMVKEVDDETKLVIVGESNHLPVEIFEIEADDYLLLPCRAAEVWRRLLASLKTASSSPHRPPELRLVHAVNRQPLNNSGGLFPALRGLFSFFSPGTKSPTRRKTADQSATWRPFVKSPS